MSRFVKDQLGDVISVPDFPKRIVSLVPSQTEFLYDLGLEERVVGITKFCIHPKDWFNSKTRIGGTKQVNIERVKALCPDLIIGNKEENTLEDIQELRKIAPVWMSDIATLEDSLTMMLEIGKLTNSFEKAQGITMRVKESFDNFVSPLSAKSVLYLIWKNPYMAAAGGTFIDDLLTRSLNLSNCLAPQTRYPAIDLEQFKHNPDYIFLSSEPFPFKETHKAELAQQFPNAKICLVDGEYFSWYGSRLLSTIDYFKRLIQEL